MKFVDVILPLPLSAAYTYALPEERQEVVRPGSRVIVPFGAKKFYTAIVVDVHGRQPQGYAVKTVWEILDSDPVLLPVQLDFWRWLADYYLCAVGDEGWVYCEGAVIQPQAAGPHAARRIIALSLIHI